MSSIVRTGLATAALIVLAAAIHIVDSQRWDPSVSASVAANGTGPTGTGPTGGTGPVTGDEGAASGGGTVIVDGSPPRIMCAWELPDQRSDLAGIQYQTEPGEHDHDDNSDALPDRDGDLANGVHYPCSGPETGGYPDQPDGVRHMVHVLPNAEDDPEAARVQVWAAVDHEAGIGAIDDVYWKVFHPDGSFKVQAHADGSGNGGIVRAEGSDTSGCTAWGDPSTADSMFHAAHHSGHVSAAAVDDINNGLIALCQQRVVAMYYAEFEISKHQPCGEYRIETHAVSNGAESVLTSYIDVYCFFDLWVDFTEINWGALQPGVEKTVAGDLDPSTPDRPSVKNRGNHGMFVGVRFSEMVQQETDGGKVIDLFDAAFGKDPADLIHANPIPAGTVTWFDDDPVTNEGLPLADAGQVLCSNEIGKLDLSIHPDSSLPSGMYAGSIEIVAKAAHTYCYTDQEIHDD